MLLQNPQSPLFTYQPVSAESRNTQFFPLRSILRHIQSEDKSLSNVWHTPQYVTYRKHRGIKLELSNSIIYLTNNLRKTISHPKGIHKHTCCLNCNLLTATVKMGKKKGLLFVHFLLCISHPIKNNTFLFFTFKTYYLLFFPS